MDTKFIFVTGGVVSSLGKGISASSLGLLLKKRGFKVVSSTPVNVVYGNGSKAMEESGPTRKLAA